MEKKLRNVLIGFFAVLLTTGFSFTLPKEQFFNSAEAGTKTGGYAISWATDFNSASTTAQGEWGIAGGAVPEYDGGKVLRFHSNQNGYFWSSEKYYIGTEEDSITLDFDFTVSASVSHIIICVSSSSLVNNYTVATAGWYLKCDPTDGWALYNGASKYGVFKDQTSNDNPFTNLSTKYHIRISRTITGVNVYLERGVSTTAFTLTANMRNIGWVTIPEGSRLTSTYIGICSPNVDTNYYIDNFMVSAGSKNNKTNISSIPSNYLSITIPSSTYVYNKKPITPVPTVKYNGITLLKDRHYIVSYSKNTDPTDEAVITITGTNDRQWMNFTGSKNINFTIRYNNYSVVFDGNGHTGGSTDTINLSYDTAFTMPACGFTKTGYKFLYWTDSGGKIYYPGTQYSGLTLTEGAEYRLYANWTDSYTVNLVTNDGTINFGEVTGYKYGQEKILPLNVTKENERFMGWYDQNGITSGNWGNKVDKILSTDYGDKTFYARWTEYGSNGNDTYKSNDGFCGGEIIYVCGFKDFVDQNKYPRVEFFTSSGTKTSSGDPLTSFSGYEGTRVWSILVPGSSETVYTEMDVRLYNPGGDGPHNTWGRVDATQMRHSGKNQIILLDWDGNFTTDVYNYYGVRSGDSIYVDSGCWDQGVEILRVRFLNNNLNSYDYWADFKRIEGTLESGYFECIVPQSDGHDVIWNQVKLYRTSTDYITTHNEIPVQTYGAAYYTWNVVTISDWNSGSITSDEYTNDERAEDYGRFICTRADQSCDPYGHSNVKTLKNDWSEYKTQYNQMNKLAEGRFWIANADESSKSYLEKGASVYDYIYGKYSPSYSSDFEDFANRQPAVMAALRFQFTLFDGSVESNNTLLIITISLVTLLSLSYFVVKKKKQNN